MTRLSREPSSVTLNTPNPESGETKILRLTFTLNDSNLIKGFDHFEKMIRQNVDEMHMRSLKRDYTKLTINIKEISA